MPHVFAIELDSRDKANGSIIRVGMYDNEPDARAAWRKIKSDADPEIQWWLIRIRDGIDDPAHCDALECKCVNGDQVEIPK
jgi:hypothetical protein